MKIALCFFGLPRLIKDGVPHDISGEKFVIGRSPKYGDLIIEDEKSVGRIHAEIVQIDEEYYIKDIDSVNGTFVNTKRIIEGELKKITKNDTISISRIDMIFA